LENKREESSEISKSHEKIQQEFQQIKMGWKSSPFLSNLMAN